MTTAERFRDAAGHPAATVSIAGVPWPIYKVVSLLVGALVFVLVGVATASAESAVLTGSGAATLTWLTLSRFRPSE